MVNGQILGELERLGFPDILLWLLTFAIVFGVLSQTKMPKSRAARGIISIAIAFLVMLSAPVNLIVFISQASSGLILVVIAILLLIAFFEAAGVKYKKTVMVGKDEKGNPVFEEQEMSIFEKYPKAFAISFVIIAILIFLGAGGWDLLGFGEVSLKGMGSQSIIGIVFIAAVILGVLWMIAETKEEK